jgi:dihydrofolate synthase/folylpolyglutamate synthase
MTKEDWLQHLEGLHPKGQAGIELGLERIRLVKAALGQTQHCPVITVGGTNGKGSTCAYLENIIDRAGYKVGCYTSPTCWNSKRKATNTTWNPWMKNSSPGQRNGQCSTINR